VGPSSLYLPYTSKVKRNVLARVTALSVVGRYLPWFGTLD